MLLLDINASILKSILRSHVVSSLSVNTRATGLYGQNLIPLNFDLLCLIFQNLLGNLYG